MKRLGIIALVITLLTACGGGGGSTTPPPPVTNASPGGIWNGTDSVSGEKIIGLITETGEFHFLRHDGVQYFGTLSTSGNNVSGTYTGITAVGTAFPDGSNYGSGTVNGTVAQRQTLNGTTTFKTSAGNTTSGTVSLKFNPLYNSGSSLVTVAGSYLDAAHNAIVTVDTKGVISEQDPVSNCTVSGRVSIIDSRYDAYSVSYSFANCTGPYAFQNGTTATGLGTIDTTVTPAIAYIGIVDSGARYVLTASYTKQGGYYSIGGTVSGLDPGAQLALKFNGAYSLVLGQNGAFMFATPVVFNGSYNVTVATQPTGEICTVANGSGTGVTANVSSVRVVCSATTYTVGGSVAGLATGAQFTLLNNGADALTVTSNSPFEFATPVAYGGSYSVTIASQPTGQTCTVTNGSGLDVTANVAGVGVTCSTNTFTVGGSVSGLAAGQQLTLYDNGGDPLVITANGAFTFASVVAYNGAYDVVVNTQPTLQTCTVSNGSGAAVTSDINSINVNCVNKSEFVYATSNSGNDIGQFSVGNTGQLTPLNPSLVAVSNSGGDLWGIAIDPTGKYAYVTNQSGAGGINQFAIGLDGTIGALSPAVASGGTQVVPVAVNTAAPYAYAGYYYDNQLAQYTRNADGTLSWLVPASIAVTAPISVAIDPTGRYAYVVDATDEAVYQFTVGVDGTLSAMATPFVLVPRVAGGAPVWIAVDPTGRYAYVVQESDNTVAEFTIGADGSLTSMTPSTVATGNQPRAMAMDPTGGFAYVTNQVDNTVSQYQIGTGGVLVPMNQPTVATDNGPVGVTAAKTGPYVYVSNFSSNTVSQFTIGAGGALIPMTPASVAAVPGAFGIATAIF